MKLKNIARNLMWDEDRTPQELATQIKNLPDSTLIAWAKSNKGIGKGIPNSPLAFQQKLVKIELAKRGLSTNNMSESLEQIVKETVAKLVAEKHLTAAEAKKKEDIVKAMKDTFKGPKAAMYAIATDKAKKLAEDDINEARVSQDNAVNYLANALEHVWNMGKGNNSIDFSNMAQSMYFDMFGGDEINEKKSQELAEFGNPSEKAAIESATGDKISHVEEDDYGRGVYWSASDPNISYYLGSGGKYEGNIYKYDAETGKTEQVGTLNNMKQEQEEFNAGKSPFQNNLSKILSPEQIKGVQALIPGGNLEVDLLPFRGYTAFIYTKDASQLDVNQLNSNLSKLGLKAEEFFDNEENKYYYYLDKVSQELDEVSIPSNVESLANKIISWYENHPNPKMQSDRLPAVEKNIEYLMSKTVGKNAWDFNTFEKIVKEKYPLVFQESQELDEWTIRKWQHYAGIK